MVNNKCFYQHISVQLLYVQWLTTEWDNMAAVFMNKLPCDCFLHDLLDLWDMETQQRLTESAECIQHDELKQTLVYSLFYALWMFPWLVNLSNDAGLMNIFSLTSTLIWHHQTLKAENKYQEGESVYEVSRKNADCDSRTLALKRKRRNWELACVIYAQSASSSWLWMVKSF